MIHTFTPEQLAERQSRAVKKAEQLAKDIMEYAHGVGELHRKYGKQAPEEEPKAIDLNDPDTQWALSCEAIGSDYWED